MKRLKYLVLVFLAFGLLLTACGPDPTSEVVTLVETVIVEIEGEPQVVEVTVQAEPQIIEVTSTPEPDPEGPVYLEFWTMLGGSLGAKVKEYIQEFNDSQDEVVILEVNLGDYEPLLQKLVASIVAGDTPAVTFVDYRNVRFFAQEGVLEPINNWMSDEELADFYPSLLTDLTFEGQVYALPFNRSYQGVYYNKDLFREAGLDPDSPPKTWDEYVEYANAISALGPDIYGTYVYRRSHEPILSFGGTISDADCNPTHNDEATIAAFQFMQDLNLVHGGLVPAALRGGFTTTAVEFIQGRVGLYSGSIAIQNLVGETVDFDWGFTLLPAGPGGQAWVGGGGNIAIGADASDREKAAAFEFVKFMTSAEQSADWHMSTGYLPTRESVATLPEIESFYAENPSWKTSVEGVEFIVDTPCVMVNVPQYVSIERPNSDRIVLNGEDPTAVTADLAAELQALIDSLREEDRLILPE